MPLQKSWSDGFGNSADYIKIAKRQEDFRNSTGCICFEGYKDSTAYSAGKNPVEQVTIPLGAATKKGADGEFKIVAFSAISGKTESQMDTAAKSGKIKWESGIIVDLSDATPV